jgi:hypothetical protein
MGGFRGGMGGFGGGMSRSMGAPTARMGAPTMRLGAPTMRMGAPPVGRVGTLDGDRAFGGQFGVRERGFGDNDRVFGGRRGFDRDRDDFFFRHRRFRDDDDFSLGLIFGFGYPFYGYAPYPYAYPYPVYPQSTYSSSALLSYLSTRWLGAGDLWVGWSGPAIGVRQVAFSLLDPDQRVIGTRVVWTPPYGVTFRAVPDRAVYVQIAVVHRDGSADSAIQVLP